MGEVRDAPWEAGTKSRRLPGPEARRSEQIHQNDAAEILILLNYYRFFPGKRKYCKILHKKNKELKYTRHRNTSAFTFFIIHPPEPQLRTRTRQQNRNQNSETRTDEFSKLQLRIKRDLLDIHSAPFRSQKKELSDVYSE